MRGFRIIAIVFVLCASFFSCRTRELGNQYIKMLNTHQGVIACQMLKKIHITEADSFIDCDLISNYRLSSDTICSIAIDPRTGDWETYFKGSTCVQFLFMDAMQFEHFFLYSEGDSPCDTIRKYVPVLQRYRLNLEDLENLNWIVPYPPTEAMKDMDIYPLYKDIEDY